MLPRDLQVMKAAKKLLDKGEEPKPYRISQMLKKQKVSVSVGRVEASLKRIQKYPSIARFVKEAKKTGWYSKIRVPKITEKRMAVLQKAHEDGYYIGAKAPVGYVKTSLSLISDLDPDPELFPKVQQVIEGFYLQGKTIPQLRTETGLPRNRIHAILFRNIRIYAGYVKFRRDWKKGRHKAAVSKEVWESIIKPTLEAPKQLYGKIPRAHATGTMYTKGRWMWEPSEIRNVQKAYKMRLKGAGINEICRETGYYPSTLVFILRNPTYINKIRVPGKPPQEWPDAGIVWPDGRKEPPPISLEDYLKVQEIRDTRPIWIASREARKKKLRERKDAIYTFIVQNEPTRAQIIKHFHGIYSVGEIDNCLSLLRENRIAKRGGKRGNFYALKET